MLEGRWFVSNAQDLVDAGAQALKMPRTSFRPVSHNKPAAWDNIPDASINYNVRGSVKHSLVVEARKAKKSLLRM